MTFTRLPGLKFTETVASSVINEAENVPLFLIQTSEEITDLDNTISYFTGFDAFQTLVEGKGLTYTTKCIEQTLQEYGNTAFYVYSIKTDTALAFTNAIVSTAHLFDVTRIIYIEEAKSANSNNINAKIKAILMGLNQTSEGGAFRTGLIIPYGTTADAVANKAAATSKEDALITSLTNTLQGVSNGKIEIALPDENAGIVTGKCMATEYNEDPGRTIIQSGLEESTYNFNATQMLQLLNLGVLFIWQERYAGGFQYKICYGVNTGVIDNKKDDLIVCRKVVDEVLRQIGFEAAGLTKAPETETNEKALQSLTDDVVNRFVTAEEIYRDGTTLTASGNGRVFQLNGKIKPIRSAHSIEVNTTIV